jgi:NADP-dependent 3-hydroxy acid dehydrogenase YdfG
MSDNWYRQNVVFVTGASSGIGEALVEQLVTREACVTAVARSQQRLEALEQRLAAGKRLQVLTADLRDQEQTLQALHSARERFGRINTVIYCAGIEYLGPLQTTSSEELACMMATNFYGLFYIVQHVLPMMREQEGPNTIVNISSPMARFAFGWSAAYAASKAASDAFMTGLRHEPANSGVRFLTLYPGPTETRAGKHLPPERLPRWHEREGKMAAAATAQRILEAIPKQRAVQACHPSIRMLLLLQRLTPALAERVIAGMPT